ncbi:hypothetical protein BKP37_02810 [Anaerobacillus alkalilacustris]|uniref:Uncharacterized protein n=1 Tax=Anaerobacillus alkalilacustris TaxID=393763 RepID=A0A1S2LYN4_9BACI|nr:hypothetical protein BKP37_02810 [Anaerobacillus alkalilacustris]
MMQKYRGDFTNTFRALTFDTIEDTSLHGFDDFEKWYERWQARLEKQQESKEASRELMQKSNPAVIPRNHRVEEALDAAVQKGDYSVMKRLLEVLSQLFAHSAEQGADYYFAQPSPSNHSYRTFCGT